MRTVIICLGFIVFVFLAVGALADVPSVINYQGFLTGPPPSNNPIQGQRDIKFSIFDDETAGDLIWDEVHPHVDVEKGIFTVWLGTAGNPLLDSHFEHKVRWLQIEAKDIDSPGDPYVVASPRFQLTTTPYAFRVATIDSASGGTIKGDVEIKDGMLGIGTASPGEILDVNGNMVVSGKAAVGPGHVNTGAFSFVAGENNETSGLNSTVGGGGDNTASNTQATVSGGSSNEASGQYSTIGGGSGNIASGDYATIPGGHNNEASGPNTSASGYRAKANHGGSFVWADQSEADFSSTGENQFLIRASGGVGVGTDDPQASLHVGGTPGVDGIMFPDGTLQTTAASVGSEVAVTTGTASHGSLITPPAGYTVAQCKCIVSPHTSGPDGSSQEGWRHWCYVTVEGGGWRVRAQSQNAHYGGIDNDIANYMVIGVK